MLTQIKAFLLSRQWEFEQLDDDTVLTGFTSPLPNGQDHGFPLFIMLMQDTFGDRFVRLVIVPYIQRTVEGYPKDLFERIARMNHNLSVAKFALDADGDLELLIDVSTDQLDLSGFDSAVQLLADYAGLHYSELTSASTEGQ